MLLMKRNMSNTRRINDIHVNITLSVTVLH